MIPPLNRSATNILSELQSALDVKQYADAARVLTTCDPPRDEGLVPAPDDDQLFISFQTALRLLMLEHRGLCEAMVQQIGPADQLKIEQTLARGDPAAVEALPLQYCGTPAAVLPCQWLGDRALAATDFVHAISWYDEGLRWASPAQQPGLAARKRLVSAMLGLAQGQPPTQPVLLGDVQVSPEKFEGWIRDQLSRRRLAAEADSPADSLPVVAAARPVMFQAATFGQLNDSAGRGYKGDELPYEFREVDWSWRHLTVLGGEDSLIAVERSRITAFNPAEGKVSLGCSPAKRLVAQPRSAAASRATHLYPCRRRLPTEPAWSALMAGRGNDSGSVIAAARRPAIRSGIAGGFICSRSDRPSDSSPRRFALWNCIPRRATCFPGSRSWRRPSANISPANARRRGPVIDWSCSWREA